MKYYRNTLQRSYVLHFLTSKRPFFVLHRARIHFWGTTKNRTRSKDRKHNQRNTHGDQIQCKIYGRTEDGISNKHKNTTRGGLYALYWIVHLEELQGNGESRYTNTSTKTKTKRHRTIVLFISRWHDQNTPGGKKTSTTTKTSSDIELQISFGKNIIYAIHQYSTR